MPATVNCAPPQNTGCAVILISVLFKVRSPYLVLAVLGLGLVLQHTAVNTT